MDPFTYPYIRDVVTINKWVQDFYTNFAGDGPVFIFGRVVIHEVPLTLGSKPLVIVADEYHGNGQMIDFSGAYGGGNGGTVTVLCKRSSNASISVSGGYGYPGANGADGTEGTPDIVIEGQWIEVADPWPMETTHQEYVPGEVIPGSPGSPAGMGGAGGPGGNAGSLTFISMSDDYPSLAADAGGGGPGGQGGFLGTEQAPEGAYGASGTASAIAYSIVSEDEFDAIVRNTIGGYTSYWAPFRIVTADYFYHQYNSRIEERANKMRLAAAELTAALKFQPDNANALRLQSQMQGFRYQPAGDIGAWEGGGNNALGLPRQMDLLPRFDYYIDTYASFGALALAFLNNGTTWLAAEQGLWAMQDFAGAQLTQVTAARDNSNDELGIAKTEQKNAAEEVTYAQQKLDKVTAEIRAVPPAETSKPFTFAGLFGTVATIGSAVLGIVALIPSGGASVVALAPSMVALLNSVSDNAEPILKSFLDDAKVTDAELEPVKKAYEKVGKNVDEVVKGGKSIISFVKLVQGLGAVTTADNSKYMALVKQGAEMAHELMFARNRGILADQRLAAATAKLARAEEVVESVKALKKALEERTHTLRQFGLAAMDIAASKATMLQTLAFRAQRSVEIYTLEDQEELVFLDAGMISPDLGRAYYEGEKVESDLAAALQSSWGRILNPLEMKLNYIAFFDARPDWDTYRLAFDDPAVLASFRDTKRLNFRIEATALRPGHFETKIKNVLVSLIGARSPSSEISCVVRHGGQYEQRRLDGKVHVQYLAPQTVNRRAKKVPLDRPIANTDPPLDAPTSMAIWGRGVGGDWELTIDPYEIESGGVDLAGLTAIEVWVDYQFIRQGAGPG